MAVRVDLKDLMDKVSEAASNNFFLVLLIGVRSDLYGIEKLLLEFEDMVQVDPDEVGGLSKEEVGKDETDVEFEVKVKDAET